MAFITLDRKFLDWQWYEDGNTVRVFLHLLLIANWQETKYKGIVLHRGEAAVTYDEISKKLGISYQQVRTAFQHLESAETLTIRRSSKFLIVTLKKYDEYQCKQQSNNNQTTIKQQSNNNPLYKEQFKQDNNITTYKGKGRKETKMILNFDPNEIEQRAMMNDPTL